VTNRKGVSQVLALIVAASVLMMTALTLIMMASGSLSDFQSSIVGSSCSETINAQCSAQDDLGTVSAPTECFEGEEPTSTGVAAGLDGAAPGDTVHCEDLNY